MIDLRAEFIFGSDVTAGQKHNRSIDVKTNMLDYDYVNDCNDIPALKEILRLLVSGKEGRYPQLEETVIEKILFLLPEKDKKKVLAMSSTISSQEVESEKAALNEWLQEMQIGRATTKTESLCSNKKPYDIEHEDIIFPTDEDKGEEMKYPPVRVQHVEGVSNKRRHFPKVQDSKGGDRMKFQNEKKEEEASNMKNDNNCGGRIPKETHSNRDYFRAWDKFDYEAAEKRVDEEDDEDNDNDDNDDLDAKTSKAVEDMNDSKTEKWKTKKNVDKQTSFDMKQLADLQSKLRVSTLSSNERIYMAAREKYKGNEYFKNKEYEQSFNCYSKSIALNDQNAIVYANRAMTCIRLSNLCQAVSDCTQALLIDPTYTKVLARRGIVHHKCGRYVEATLDFKACVKQDSENREYQQLLKKSEEKHSEVNGIQTHEKTKKKIVIVQEDDSDSDSDCNDVDEIYTPGFLRSM